jgi:hypothetical protein
MENPSHEFRPGRLFIHGRLNDPITGGRSTAGSATSRAAWSSTRPSTTARTARSGFLSRAGCPSTASSSSSSAAGKRAARRRRRRRPGLGVSRCRWIRGRSAVGPLALDRHRTLSSLPLTALTHQNIEDEAQWLAGALLLTEDAALHIARNGISAQAAADHFGIGTQMVTYRLNITGARKRVVRAKGFRIVR